MKNESCSIAYEDSVWDLHIHTCKCSKASSEFKDMPLSKYIDGLVEIFNSHKDLKMISFTDHNQINDEVYREFLGRKTGITLIIGIEVDVFLDESEDNKNIKHIIFYFDNTKFDIDIHAKPINEYLQNKEAIDLSKFLHFLITKIKIPFLISPHVMKQKNRAIDYDWDEEKTKKNIDKYIDQMCCFWETSNNSNIEHARIMLEEFDRKERVSIISFSDSNNFEKLNNYLNAPCQYFSALPTFEGLRLAGSDCRRIHFKKVEYDSEIRASSIGKITLGNNTIFLSPGLNAIVGGRGSGKSLLLDKIVSALDYEKISEIYSSKDSKDRKEFLNQFQIKVYDGNNVDLSGHTFVFDYYNQGYAQELFKKDKGDSIPSLYFCDEFSKLKDFNEDLIKGKMLEEISFTEKEKEVCENLTSLTDKIVIISEEKEDLKLPELSKEKKDVIYPSIEILLKYLSKKEIIPQELKDNKKIKKAQLDYISVIYGEIYLYNKDMLIEGLPGLIKKKYDEAVQKKNKKKKEKAKAIKHLRILIKNLFADTINRVEQINQIIEASTIDFNDKDSFEKEGETGTRFIFQKSLYCENLLDFLLRILYENFDSYKLQKRQLKKDKEYFFELIKLYCYHCDEVIMESKTVADVYEKLKKLDSINIEKKEDIFVIKNNKKLDLKKLSPGTRANFLLEYIFFKESKNPLLIDQPEDNIDNETIYERLTEWFSLSKKKRQIIVVTHDANIVINADSENVIICKQEDENIFDYENGALEYKDILSKVSKLLDGGKQAIERRLLKYGK